MTDANKLIDLKHLLSHQQPLSTYRDSINMELNLNKQTLIKKRILSFIIDFSVIIFVKNLFTIAYATFLSDFLAQLSSAKKIEMLQLGLPWELGIFGVIFFSYFLISNYTFEGKTVGNKWMKIHIINDNYPFNYETEEYTPNFKQSLLRSFSYVLCYLSFGLFFFLTFLNKERRGLADALSQTRVVSDQWLESYKLEKLAYQEQIRIDINSLETSRINHAA